MDLSFLKTIPPDVIRQRVGLGLDDRLKRLVRDDLPKARSQSYQEVKQVQDEINTLWEMRREIRNKGERVRLEAGRPADALDYALNIRLTGGIADRELRFIQRLTRKVRPDTPGLPQIPRSPNRFFFVSGKWPDSEKDYVVIYVHSVEVENRGPLALIRLWQPQVWDDPTPFAFEIDQKSFLPMRFAPGSYKLTIYKEGLLRLSNEFLYVDYLVKVINVSDNQSLIDWLRDHLARKLIDERQYEKGEKSPPGEYYESTIIY